MGDKVVTRIAVKVSDPALMPSKAHPNDAGYDLRAADTYELLPGERQVIPTGVFLGLPDGYEAQIRPRSGLAAKYGLTIVNSPGTIDAGYRGEIKIIALNTGEQPVCGNKGDRIAQMVIHRLPLVGLDLVDDLDTTDRGADGFGSSGVS